jgi:hypothetical protein
MSIFDTPPVPTTDPPNQAAVRAARVLERSFKQAEKQCKQIKKIADTHGMAALNTEFGAEAGDFLAMYNLVMAMANNHPECNAEALPAP